MTKVKERLQEIIHLISKKLPDDPDLKGFLGISKPVILSILEDSVVLVEKLKEFDNHFETIVLKRELDDLLSKVKGNLKKDFGHINLGTFNSILRDIARIKEKVRSTYFTVVNEEHVRTEAELLRIREDLTALLADTKELLKVKQSFEELQGSTVQKVDAVTQEIETLRTTAANSINNVMTEVDGLKQNTVTGINAFYDQTKGTKEKTDILFADLVEREKTTTQHAKKVEEIVSNLEKKNASIETISSNVDQWNLDIGKAHSEMTTLQKKYSEHVELSKSLLIASERIKDKIAGKVNEDNVLAGGLLQDAERLTSDLSGFLDKQKEKYDTQFKEIEELVAGATTVGLAAAYKEQKESYRKPLFRWSVIFVATLVVMTAFSGYVIYEQFQSEPINTLNEALTALFRYLPFYVPTIWLVSHASKQQSQARRLQQDYAFKETNAKAFQGHKDQIEKLIKEGAADKEMLVKMMAQMVVITGQNPSSTLQHESHNDNSPLLKVFERIVPWKKKEDEKANTNRNSEDLN